MSLDIKLFKEICEAPGAPGFENKIREIIKNEIRDYVDEISVDNMGNVIGLRKGTHRKKLMAAAHMDEIGFIVTHIDENGFLRFHTLGGFDPKTLTAQRVIVHGKKDLIGVMGSKPIHLMTSDEKIKHPKVSDYFIDLGMGKKEAEKFIKIGDPITRQREFIEVGDCVNSKSIDNRVAVYILIETLRNLKGKTLPHDFYCAFTVQEEVGLRGAMVASHYVEPDFSIAIDTTVAYDLPGALSHEVITRLGEGVAIKIMDASVICDQRMVRFITEQAEKNKIKFQREVLTVGGTDAGAMQRTGKNGSITGAISIPTRHLHQVIEMADKSDIKGAISLLTHCIQQIDKFQWGEL